MKLRRILTTSSLMLISGAVYAQYDTVVMCRACPAGYKGGGDKQYCDGCGAGTYQPSAGQSSCIDITDGKNCSTGSANTDYTSCTSSIVLSCKKDDCSATSCKDGYYLSGGKCYICPAGSYCKNSVKNTCSAGTYSSGEGWSSCSNCSAGTYSGEGASSCTNCPAGKYSSSAGSSSCSTCSAGTYSGAGASGCSTCSAGTYSGAGSSSCTPCTGNYYQPSAGQSSCSYCTTSTSGHSCTYSCQGSCAEYNYSTECVQYGTIDGCSHSSNSNTGTCYGCIKAERKQGSCKRYNTTTCNGTQTYYYRVNSAHTSCDKYDTGNCS